MSRCRLLPFAPFAALAALVATAATPGFAAEPPHWASASFQINCTLQCHTVHGAPGGSLTSAASNVNLCQTCHSPSGLANALSVSDSDRAVPGVSGTSHAFDRTAVNAALGTQLPLDTAMAQRVLNGNVVCSTCHDQHSGGSTNGGTPRVSPAQKITDLGTTGTLLSGGTPLGPASSWYLVEIATGGTQTTARFGFSKDNGVTWEPAACDPPNGAVAACLTAATTPVTLADGITATFTAGSFALHERWQFSASWPFLRHALDAGDNATGVKFCRDCHRSWEMDHTALHTWDGTKKSHPVGVALNVNGLGYDRAVPLDGNGAPQGSVGRDGNLSNDYPLDAGGRLQCLSCHGVHRADSNTSTEDVR